MAIYMVSPSELQTWLGNKEAVLIDVREDNEYQAAHIPGSVHIPLASCNIDTIPQAADKKIVFHCKKGGRAGKACEKHHELFPDSDVWNLEGGMEAWVEAGYEVA